MSNINQYEPGDTVSDGWQTYVMRYDGHLHYVGSGNHAKYHVSAWQLDLLVSNWEKLKQ